MEPGHDIRKFGKYMVAMLEKSIGAGLARKVMWHLGRTSEFSVIMGIFSRNDENVHDFFFSKMYNNINIFMFNILLYGRK